MRQLLRRAAKQLAYHPLAESLVRRIGGGARILSYHRFPPELAGELRHQCEYYRRNFTPISLDTFVDALTAGKPLPRNALVITIDDGYADSCTVAAPIFQEFGIPATVYLVTGFLDQNTWLWWDQLSYAFARSVKDRVRLVLPQGPMELDLGPASNRTHLATQCSIALLRTDAGQAQSLLTAICEQLQVPLPTKPPPEYLPLSWEQVRAMHSMGFTFGSHTVSHRILGTIPSWEDRRGELIESKRRIEQQTGLPVRHFCFPNGGIGDFAHTDINLLRAAGYSSAVTLYIGLAGASTDPFLIPRITVNPDQPFPFFRMKVAGAWRFQGSMNQPLKLPLRF